MPDPENKTTTQCADIFAQNKQKTVSETMPTEPALFSSNDWEDLFQAIGSPTIILDKEYQILYANRSALKATGRSLEQMIGLKCYQVFHSVSTTQSSGCPLEKLLRSGGVETAEMEVEAMHGTYLVTCTPVFDDANELSRIIHIATPVTEQNRVKKELEAQNKYLAQLNEFSLELGRLAPTQDLEAFITQKLKKFTGASGVTLSRYDPEAKALFAINVEAESWILNQARGILGKSISRIPSPVTDEVRDEIIKNQVGIKKTLHEASFGGISPRASKLIGRLLNADRYIGLAFVYDNRLYGTSLLVMADGANDPPFEILRTFGYLVALAMQRRQSAEILRASEAKYRLLVHNIHEGVVMVDNDDTIQFINPAACHIYGYEESALIGKISYRMLIHPDDWHVIRDKNALRQTGVSDAYEIRGKKRTGEVVWLRISGSPVKDKDARVIGSIGIIADITETKQNEERLRIQNAYLDELIEGAAEAIVVLDNDDRVQRINKEFSNIFEYCPEEAVGQRINDLIVPENLQDEGWRATSDVARGERISLETVRMSKSGKLINVSILGNPILVDGAQVGVYGIYRDITRNVYLEHQLRQTQRLDSIGQLAGGVAHDFNNMLSVILGYSDELMESIDPEDYQFNSLLEIKNAGIRAMNLTNQLLAFSRRQMIHPQTINLNAIVEDMINMLHRLISEDISIETNLANDLASIKADTSQIEQVILNLVVNARDAMPNGGKILIETSNYSIDSSEAISQDLAAPGDYVLLNITDNGTGMDTQIKERIFEPFFSTKDKSLSSGLGLATVYGIVKQAEGYLWVYSEPGSGTSFKILFPQTYDAAVEAARYLSPKPIKGKGESILVVEDEEMLRNLIREMITKLGYSVTLAMDADEARELVIREGLRPDLIITDVIMPGMNGKELADLLHETIPELRFLFMSGYTEDIIGDRGKLDQGIPFIQKPFSRNQIAEKIREMLGS